MKSISLFQKNFWRLCVALLLAAAPAGASAQAISVVTPNPACEGDSVTVHFDDFDSITRLSIGSSAVNSFLTKGDSVRFSAPAGNLIAPWNNILFLEGKNTLGATITVSDTITIFPTLSPSSPSITSNPSDSAGILTVCSGTSVTLQATPWQVTGNHRRYRWYKNGTLIESTYSTSNIRTFSNISVSDAGTYRSEVSYWNNSTAYCSKLSTDSITIVVNLRPSISFPSNNVTICKDESHRPAPTITPNSSCSWTWAGTGPPPNPSGCDPALSIAGTYTLTATAASCSSSANFTLNVREKPNVSSLTVTSPQKCGEKGSVQINVSPSGTWRYQQKNQNGSWPSAWGTDNKFSGLDPGTYTFRVGYSSEPRCPAETTVVVSNLALPSVSITAAPASLSICTGQTITLTAVATGGSAPYSYRWSNNSTANAISVSPASSNDFSVTVTDANSCSINSSRRVTVSQLPNVGNSGQYSICAKDSIELSAPFNSNFRYIWTPATHLTHIVNNRATFRWPTNESTIREIELTVINNVTGCENKRTDRITVNRLPTLEVELPDKILSDILQEIILKPDPSNALLSWVFDPNQVNYQNPIRTSGTEALIEGKYVLPNDLNEASSFYYVTVTDASSGCSSIDTIRIEVESNNDPCATINRLITPNGDNVNDEWKIELPGSEQSLHVQLFSYAGLKIWEDHSSGRYWQGEDVKGVPCPPGSYWYIATTPRLSCRGSVTLLR